MRGIYKFSVIYTQYSHVHVCMCVCVYVCVCVCVCVLTASSSYQTLAHMSSSCVCWMNEARPNSM